MLVSLECVENIRWQLCTPLQLNVHTHTHTARKPWHNLLPHIEIYVWHDVLTTLQREQNAVFYMISLDMPLFELSNYGLFVRAKTSQQHSKVHARCDNPPTQDR